jgi:hypothetical protein
MCQSSIEIAYDTELLKDMAAAGCTSIFFGIESLNPKSLTETHKFHNRISRYKQAIQNVHSVGINVVGSFIVGFDADDLDAFDHIYEFTDKNNISYIMLNVLTAYPGTDLYNRMKKAGRLNDMDPGLLNGIYPTMRYRNMYQTDMFEKYFLTLEKMFDYGHVRKKALQTLGNGAFQRFNEGEISPLDKFISLIYLIGMFVFTRDKSKRKIFYDLFALGLQKKINMGVVVEFLLFVASFHGYLEYTLQHRDKILDIIRKNDRGPWKGDGDDTESLTRAPCSSPALLDHPE